MITCGRFAGPLGVERRGGPPIQQNRAPLLNSGEESRPGLTRVTHSPERCSNGVHRHRRRKTVVSILQSRTGLSIFRRPCRNKETAMGIQKTLIGLGLLLCGFMMGLPRISSAAAGCGNTSLNGTYNVQVENASFVNVLTALRAGATNSGSTTLPPPPTGGFGDNPKIG